jgi:hypothetical protein
LTLLAFEGTDQLPELGRYVRLKVITVSPVLVLEIDFTSALTGEF